MRFQNAPSHQRQASEGGRVSLPPTFPRIGERGFCSALLRSKMTIVSTGSQPAGFSAGHLGRGILLFETGEIRRRRFCGGWRRFCGGWRRFCGGWRHFGADGRHFGEGSRFKRYPLEWGSGCDACDTTVTSGKGCVLKTIPSFQVRVSAAGRRNWRAGFRPNWRKGAQMKKTASGAVVPGAVCRCRVGRLLQWCAHQWPLTCAVISLQSVPV